MDKTIGEVLDMSDDELVRFADTLTYSQKLTLLRVMQDTRATIDCIYATMSTSAATIAAGELLKRRVFS
jgi:hypothetical protein